ncbi:MAG: acylphosphatase [Rhizobiaceae bacterium]|nr:acylphosphatase [Rhizobiaceae bacterium]
MAELHIVRVTVTGRVQGVNFRRWTKRHAEALNIRGWVRNEPGGSVAALLAGRREDVDALVAKMHKGPAAARVATVSVEDAPDEPAPVGFDVLDSD